MRLNPFEFRAGIYLAGIVDPDANTRVLIPLNSGLVFTLINSDDTKGLYRLNPFEFRAGIYLKAVDA